MHSAPPQSVCGTRSNQRKKRLLRSTRIDLHCRKRWSLYVAELRWSQGHGGNGNGGEGSGLGGGGDGGDGGDRREGDRAGGCTAAARAAEAATAMALHDCHWGPLRCHLCSDHLARLVLKATCAYARHAICDRINREQNCSFSCAKQDPSRHARDRHHMGTVAHGRWAS